MIDRTYDLLIARQAKVLNVSRSSVYYKPRPVSTEVLAIMRRIDELHLDHPFAGSRMLRDMGAATALRSAIGTVDETHGKRSTVGRTRRSRHQAIESIPIRCED